ncbi:MAG: hypothetical protein UY50_C0013G0007 [Parcubacteria group bacterium GW2011_GWA2_49_9]|nr:MAG: hypothetical protein UY50_C0013G0007 [Parcubacteria group bacterium GW2011_GWA2_49_9]
MSILPFVFGLHFGAFFFLVSIAMPLFVTCILHAMSYCSYEPREKKAFWCDVGVALLGCGLIYALQQTSATIGQRVTPYTDGGWNVSMWLTGIALSVGIGFVGVIVRKRTWGKSLCRQ